MPELNLKSPSVLGLFEYIIQIITDSYWNEIASAECLQNLPKKDLIQYHWDAKSRTLFYKGRVGKDKGLLSKI